MNWAGAGIPKSGKNHRPRRQIVSLAMRSGMISSRRCGLGRHRLRHIDLLASQHPDRSGHFAAVAGKQQNVDAFQPELRGRHGLKRRLAAHDKQHDDGARTQVDFANCLSHAWGVVGKPMGLKLELGRQFAQQSLSRTGGQTAPEWATGVGAKSFNDPID